MVETRFDSWYANPMYKCLALAFLLNASCFEEDYLPPPTPETDAEACPTYPDAAPAPDARPAGYVAMCLYYERWRASHDSYEMEQVFNGWHLQPGTCVVLECRDLPSIRLCAGFGAPPPTEVSCSPPIE